MLPTLGDPESGHLMSPGFRTNGSAQLESWGYHAETTLGMAQKARIGLYVLCPPGLPLFAPYHAWLPRCSTRKHTLAFEARSQKTEITLETDVNPTGFMWKRVGFGL